MKFTQVAADAFQKLQLNAGVLTTEFDPTSPTLDKSKIFGATSGGVAFATNPEYVDFGEDIDNVPPNTKQLKRLQSVAPTMSGTLKTADTAVAKALMAAADISGNKITPRRDLEQTDFSTIWWVGDRADGGMVAVKLMNALSTGGFSLQTSKNGKGQISIEITGHVSIDAQSVVPMEFYSADPPSGNG
jgi:hypothetical protein